MNRHTEEILIVDDKPANLKLLTQVLAGQGYHVRAASSGKHALESVHLSPPHLILLDIKMPGMNGFEVCESLKADPLTGDIPVIFISALDDVQEKVHGFQAGGVDYITKPFQVEEVLARVETHLGLRRLQKQLQDANVRMARELQLAALTQANFIPRNMPQVEGWDFAATLIPARETSGDFYDVFHIQGGAMGILVADVVDKGVAAALFMVLAWSLIREGAEKYPADPDKIYDLVNDKLLSIMEDLVFVSAFLGVLDPHSGSLTYVNAGHPPPWLCRATGGLEPLALTGIPLGIDHGTVWHRGETHLDAGDALVLYTDGIIEACDQVDQLYGMDRLKQCIQQYAPSGVRGIQQAILTDVMQFLEGNPPQDDVALMVIKRNPEVA